MFRRGKSIVPVVEGGSSASAAEAETARRNTDSILEIASTHSRTSSIFSTGTKTSINTLPQAQAESHSGPIDVLVGRRNFRITARPGSILSIASYDHPAPPYSEITSIDAAQSTTTLTGNEDVPSSPTTETSPTEHATPIPRRHRQLPLLTRSTEPSSPGGIAQRNVPLTSTASSSRSNSPPSPPLSPLTSSTNAISAHYTSVVRTIDSNHRAEIDRLNEEHAAALAQIRNDIDAAYRIPFREARGRADRLAAEVEVLKQRADVRELEFEALAAKCEEAEARAEALKTELKNIGAASEARIAIIESDSLMAIQRARNEVEDFWENSWRDRMKVATDELERATELGRVQGEREGRVAGRMEGANRQVQVIKEILEGISPRSSPAVLEIDMQQLATEILEKLNESSTGSSTSKP